MRAGILCLVVPAFCITSAFVAEATDCLSLYDYDNSKPPEVDQSFYSEDEDMTTYKLTIHSTNQQLVPTLLSIPRKKGGPFPVIILLHGYGGDKEGAMEVAGPLAQYGYACAAIDAQYHGERQREGKDMYSADTNETINAFVQTIVDVRRLIDHLETRTDVDGSQIGLAGGSMGGLLGAIAAGVEKRIDVPVLMVGGGNMQILVGQSQLGQVQKIRAELERTGRTVGQVAMELECIDPINFVDRISPRPLLMINGFKDDIVPTASNRALYAKAKEPKKIIWYNTGHDVPMEKAARNAMFWFEKHLKHKFYLQTWFHLLIIVAVAVPVLLYIYRRTSSTKSQ